MQTSDQQLTIYEGINAASRDEARKLKVGTGREHIFIPYSTLALKPIGNWRKPAAYQTHEEWEEELGIPLLADQIYANCGPSDAIQGDVEKGSGKFFIDEGQRRWMAIGYLLNVKNLTEYPDGSRIDRVEVLCNPSGFTDAERLKKNHSSQNKMPLKPSQMAAGFLLYKNSIMDENGKPFTNSAIAAAFGFSRQYIDNMLLINELDPETLRQLDYNEISQKDALATKRKKKEPLPYTGDHKLAITGNGTIEVAGDKVEEFFDSLKSQDRIPADDEQPEEIELPAAGTIKVDTTSALEAEEQSRKTAKTVPEQKNNEKKEYEEAMAGLGYNPDELSGDKYFKMSISNLDKMAVIVEALPKELNQYKTDLLTYIGYNIKNLDEIKTIVKELSE